MWLEYSHMTFSFISLLWKLCLLHSKARFMWLSFKKLNVTKFLLTSLTFKIENFKLIDLTHRQLSFLLWPWESVWVQVLFSCVIKLYLSAPRFVWAKSYAIWNVPRRRRGWWTLYRRHDREGYQNSQKERERLLFGSRR